MSERSDVICCARLSLMSRYHSSGTIVANVACVSSLPVRILVINIFTCNGKETGHIKCRDRMTGGPWKCRHKPVAGQPG